MTYGFSIKLKKGSSVTDEDPGRAPFGFIVYSYQVKNKSFAKQPLQSSNRKRSTAFEKSRQTAPTSPWASRHISLSVSKSDLHDLHFHPVVPDLGEKPEKAADRRIFQIVVPHHIAPAGYLQTVVPWGKLAFRIRNREI